MPNTFITWIENALASFLGVSKHFLDAVLPALKIAAKNGAEQILPIAAKVVLALAEDPSKSGAEKQAAAVSQIKDIAKAQGLTFATSAVNIAIELAVQGLAAQQPSSDAPKA